MGSAAILGNSEGAESQGIQGQVCGAVHDGDDLWERGDDCEVEGGGGGGFVGGEEGYGDCCMNIGNYNADLWNICRAYIRQSRGLMRITVLVTFHQIFRF